MNGVITSFHQVDEGLKVIIFVILYHLMKPLRLIYDDSVLQTLFYHLAM